MGIFELESNLLDALEDALYGLGPEDLPTFGLPDDDSSPTCIENGAEILTLDGPVSPHSSVKTGGSPSPRSPLKPSQRVAQAVEMDAGERKLAFDKMMEAAMHLNELYRDSEESQQL